MNSDPLIASYFNYLADTYKPSLEQIMEQNFCFNLKLEDYAELSHRSLSTFKRDFMNFYKTTPGKWLSERRVRYAANMIVNTNLSVSQVAFESGFEDLSHFSRVFKKMMGSNPTEYKKTMATANN